MNVLLSSAIWQLALLYLDDIVLFWEDANSYIAHLRQVLTLLWDAGVQLKLEKCSLFSEKMKYIGQFIRTGRLELAEVTTAAKRERKDATNQTEMRSILEKCSVFCRFVLNFSEVTAPYNKTLRNVHLKLFLSLTQTKKDVVENLKKLLTNRGY